MNARIFRKIVPSKKKRFQENGFDLDLSYITDHILVMGYPSEINTKWKLRTGNPISEVERLLENVHKDHYRVYNLCSEGEYPPTYFGGRIALFPFDHERPPPFSSILGFIDDVKKWLQENPNNVIVVHCRSGTARSGVMIACLLLALKKCLSTNHAMQTFANQRTLDGKNPITIPSQIMYISYYEQYLLGKVPKLNVRKKILKIVMHTIPDFNLFGGCDPWFSISNSKQRLFMSPTWYGKKGLAAADFDCGSTIAVDDITIEFYNKDFANVMFSITFNTAFIQNNKLVFYKRDLDRAHLDTEHKHFHMNFKIEIYFKDFEKANPPTIPFKECLANPKYLAAFEAFLVENHAEENLLFYKAALNYESIPDSEQERRVQELNNIINTFIRPGSPHEINVNYLLGQAVLNTTLPTSKTLDPLKTEVQNLIIDDPYRRFMVSAKWAEVGQELVANRKYSVLESYQPICAKCFKPVNIQNVATLNSQHIHWDCLECKGCGKKMGMECVIKNGEPYCANCEPTFFPLCAGCNDKILSHDYQWLQNLLWHDKCFVCCVCKNNPGDLDYNNSTKSLYCKEHLSGGNAPTTTSPPASPIPQHIKTNEYVPLPAFSSSPSALPPSSPSVKHIPSSPPSSPSVQHLPSCHRCQKPIRGEFLIFTINEGATKFHPQCATCAECGAPLEGVYIERNGQLLCDKHLSEKPKPLCSACKTVILDINIILTLDNKTWHYHCFQCTLCHRPLGTDYYTTINDRPFCPECRRKIYAHHQAKIQKSGSSNQLIDQSSTKQATPANQIPPSQPTANNTNQSIPVGDQQS